MMLMSVFNDDWYQITKFSEIESGHFVQDDSTNARKAFGHLKLLESQVKSASPFDQQVAALLDRIDEFCRKKNWSHGYFGKVVVGDDRFVPRLRETGRVYVVTLSAIEHYLDDHS